MSKITIGIFNNQKNAEDSINELKTAGYSGNDISVIAKDDTDNLAQNIFNANGAEQVRSINTSTF